MINNKQSERMVGMKSIKMAAWCFIAVAILFTSVTTVRAVSGLMTKEEAVFEKEALINEVKNNKENNEIKDVPSTEESARISKEEKDKLIKKAERNKPADELKDLPPTEESIMRSREEKEKLIKDIEKNMPISELKDLPPTEASIRKSKEEKDKLIAEAEGKILDN